MTNPNDPAFQRGGLTKREEFAKAAMQGLIMARFTNSEQIAGWALRQADALIAELNKGPI